MLRIGVGQDLHRLVRGRRFILAGVDIPAQRGEQGHSDGDVLAHAVCDAILGASGLGDIGSFFPPSDPVFKDADSMALLRAAFEQVKKAGWRLVNLDSTVCCEQPQVLPYRNKIRSALAQVLEVQPDAVFVKGKTAEGRGPIGRGRAVEAWAVCLLESSENQLSMDGGRERNQ